MATQIPHWLKFFAVELPNAEEIRDAVFDQANPDLVDVVNNIVDMQLNVEIPNAHFVLEHVIKERTLIMVLFIVLFFLFSI